MGRPLVISLSRQYTSAVGWALAPIDGSVLNRIVVVDAAHPRLEEEAVAALESDRLVIVYGGMLHSSRVLRLVENGIRGYVTEIASPRDFRRAVGNVASGEVVLPFVPPSDSAAARLTAMERAVADAYLVQWGQLSRMEVAAALGMSVNTLKNHLASVREKLGVQPRTTRSALERQYRAVTSQ